MACKRKDISLDAEVLKTAKALWKERQERGLSMLVSNLIKEDQQRRHPKPGIQASADTRMSVGERAAEVGRHLTEDFKGYMGRCLRETPDPGDKSAMFESWALQKLAWLTARVDSLGAKRI